MLCAYMITCLCDYMGMGFSFWDIDWVLGFLRVLLEKHLINAVSNWNSSNTSGLSLSGNEIRRCLCDSVLTWSELSLSMY